MAAAVPWIVAGRYEVGEVVGRGGYGMVRRAIDLKTGQLVAMKVLSADAGKDPHWVERMLREQQAMVAMAGTCAVSVVDLCRLASGAPCLIMEWLEGRDLERQLCEWEALGKLPSLDLVLEILRPLASTLQRAHELGIVHRDIKPANVFLTAGATDSSTANGAVRLLDFGLSRMRSATPLTVAGMVMGSPSYIPPETWRGNSSLIDHRADLYSLAVIVFRMLAGQLPFETPSLVEKLQLVTTGERPSVCALRADLPSTADDWMKRALAIEPDQRFQSAREFYDTLTRALCGAPVPLADDELSGVRERANAASALAQNRNVLSAAWQRATSLLQRFIGQKAVAQAARASDAPAASAEPSTESALVPPSERFAPPSDRLSVAWLDDSDLEDLPESTLPAQTDDAGAPEAQSKSRARKARGHKKNTEQKPKTKQPKSHKAKAAKASASPKPARAKKPKAKRKRH